MSLDRLMDAGSDGAILDLSARPDLRAAADRLVAGNLPVFMTWASPGNWRWHRIYKLYPRFQFAVLDDSGAVAATVHAVPVAWDQSAISLPGGYDDVLVQAASRPAHIDAGASLCLLSISVRSDLRRSGMTARLLAETKRRAREEGLHSVIGPLRPTRKAAYPFVDMAAYVDWKTDDGTTFDPWLRQHLALGARVLGIAERSVVITQPRARWEQVTGRDMSAPALYPVEGALAPVEIDAAGIGTYVEPNVWIVHRTGAREGVSASRLNGEPHVRH